MSDTQVSKPRAVSAASLGGPGQPDPLECSAAAMQALSAAVGGGARLNSMQLEVSTKALGTGSVVVHARVDKRTKSIAFASVEALSSGEMVYRAQGLFGLVKSQRGD